uniref:Uncharacterized protein n=1 Tax=Anopheles dirus TaxID=7168 RepID=A0A182NWK8_9DIPT
MAPGHRSNRTAPVQPVSVRPIKNNKPDNIS